MEKRGQTTIFVIVGILIIVSGILAYTFFPQIKGVISGGIEPNTYLAECIKPAIDEGIETLSKQGGYINPEGYVLYQGEKVKYLCYTAQYYDICKVQQPLIKAHFENELESLIDSKTADCISELKEEYRGSGYKVSGGDDIRTSVFLVPESIAVNIKAPLTVTKDSTQKFDKFEFVIRSEMYDLLMISTSLLDYESTYGDSETTIFSRYYPNLVIEKNVLGDGTTIYRLEDVTTDDEFTFASRSLAWPGGYGLEA